MYVLPIMNNNKFNNNFYMPAAHAINTSHTHRKFGGSRWHRLQHPQSLTTNSREK